MPDWFSATFADLPLLALFLYAFLAATLLPGGSEIALAAYVVSRPANAPLALALATLGNSLGGMTSWACGRVLPETGKIANSRAAQWLQRWGAPALLLSWLPLVGDLLCVAAGWLRIGVWPSLLFIALGKAARYWLVVQAALLTG